MRNLILAALGVFAVAGVASAQQPARVIPASGTTIIRGNGCSSCGSTSKFAKATGGDCQLGNPCQNGCGSLKSDLGFHFGSCKNFFNPCGPKWGGGCGGLFGPPCPTLPFAQPYGIGWQCPRQFDSYANH